MTKHWAGSICVAMLLGTLACATQARAQGMAAQPEYLPDDAAERDKQAQAEFAKGKAAYEAGEYRAAWAHFHDAYRLSARPELLYNIGQTADRLRMDSDALKAFRMYLEKLPDAANRREVENRVHVLEELQQRNAAQGTDGTSAGTGVMDIAPAAPESEPPPPPTAKQPAREGWYFRAALGLGVRRDAASGGGSEATFSGFGASLDLALGMTMLPGFAVGGGLFFDGTSTPTRSSGGADTALSSGSLAMLGPMFDWYIDPELDGWHLQGALTLAFLDYTFDTTPGGSSVGLDTSTGVGLIAGFGYEWPFAQTWAVGAMGRLVVAGLAENDYTHGVFSPSVLATVTWY
jgi:hypothetical protein